MIIVTYIKKNLITLVLPAFLLTGCQTSQKSQVSVDYYHIKGDSTAALDKEIQRKGPKINGGRHAVAVAKIKIIPNVAFSPYSGGCRVSKAKVTVDAKVILPKWSGRSAANKKMGEAWDSIDRYTRLHEAVHVSTAFRHAGIIESRLLALNERVSCKILRKRARTIVANLLKQHDEEQKKFDKDEQAKFLKYAQKGA